AVHVAAGDALMRLHQVETGAPPRFPCRAGKRPVAPEVADAERIHLEHMARAPPLARARDQGHLGARALQRRQRPRNDALSPAEGFVALAHNRKLQARPPSSSFAAACTVSTGSTVRHSLTLPPPQPSWPHG